MDKNDNIIKEVSVVNTLFYNTLNACNKNKKEFTTKIALIDIFTNEEHIDEKKHIIKNLDNVGKIVATEYEKYLKSISTLLQETKGNNSKYFMITELIGDDDYEIWYRYYWMDKGGKINGNIIRKDT